MVFRHGPGLQHAVDFEPKIVVELCGAMFLDDEHATGARAFLLRPGSGVLSKLRLFVFS